MTGGFGGGVTGGFNGGATNVFGGVTGGYGGGDTGGFVWSNDGGSEVGSDDAIVSSDAVAAAARSGGVYVLGSALTLSLSSNAVGSSSPSAAPASPVAQSAAADAGPSAAPQASASGLVDAVPTTPGGGQNDRVVGQTIDNNRSLDYHVDAVAKVETKQSSSALVLTQDRPSTPSRELIESSAKQAVATNDAASVSRGASVTPTTSSTVHFTVGWTGPDSAHPVPHNGEAGIRFDTAAAGRRTGVQSSDQQHSFVRLSIEPSRQQAEPTVPISKERNVGATAAISKSHLDAIHGNRMRFVRVDRLPSAVNGTPGTILNLKANAVLIAVRGEQATSEKLEPAAVNLVLASERW